MFLGVALLRLGYPYELEWMAGAFVDHVVRILEGEKLYVEPTMDYVPFLYAPVYFYASAGMSQIVGEGFTALRLVSIIASLGTFSMMFLLIRRYTGRITPAFVAAGLFAACYAEVDSWYDTARTDSLFLCVVAGVICCLGLGQGKRSAIIAGLLLTIAYMTKQTGLLLLPFFGLAALIHNRPRAIWFGVVFLVTLGLSVLALDSYFDGWFTFYTWTLPRRHEYTPTAFLQFWFEDLVWLYPLLVSGGWYLASLYLNGQKALALSHACWSAGMIAAACSSRMHVGGAKNVIMPAHFAICIIAALALDHAIDRYRKGKWPKAIPLILIVQFLLLIYNPSPYLPSEADRIAGDTLITTMRETKGPVLLPMHGYLPRMAGKKTRAHTMAVLDVLRGADDELEKKLEHEFWNTARREDCELVILDTPGFGDFSRLIVPAELLPQFAEAIRTGVGMPPIEYGLELLFSNPDVFHHPVGLKTRPQMIFRKFRR